MSMSSEQKFKLSAPYKPTGDQPKAIKQLVKGIKKGYNRQTLLGVTGSGKTYSLANVIAQTQKPALVISHNKTLAAQLAEEFRDFFPNNAVEYFVSYYDYYQPEAYIPQTDTYIAKDSSINEEIDRLRHAAMESVLARQDVIVVASVSCIYGLGTPADYLDLRLQLKVGDNANRQDILRHLTRLQYQRNDIDLLRGTFRVRGDIIDIHPAGEDEILRLELFGSKIESLFYIDELTSEVLRTIDHAAIFPATFFITSPDNIKRAISDIQTELKERIAHFKKRNQLVEAQRIEQRTTYDIEMIEQLGYVAGIENYSRHIDGRNIGQPPATLIDYFRHSFGHDFLTLIDESHMTIPQISAMHGGDKARKDNLIRHGFRLPSAYDNRPLQFNEFEDHIEQTIFVSATPGEYETNTNQQTAEQIVRPTGLLDPIITIKPTTHQIDDVIDEAQQVIKKQQRIIITTLTKRMAEELSTYLIENGIKATYIHSDVETLERIEILRSLRQGAYDVLVGINLLREGLDLPEVSLVAIMDADKEGYLRSRTALIQVMGRAARHLDGRVIMYADTITGSIKQAIQETKRRRTIQRQYNKQHHITPASIKKAIRPGHDKSPEAEIDLGSREIPADERRRLIKELTAKMDLASRNLEYEKAARLRDVIKELRQDELRRK